MIVRVVYVCLPPYSFVEGSSVAHFANCFNWLLRYFIRVAAQYSLVACPLTVW